MAHRIIAKAALSIIQDDIQEAAGCRQLCAGQIAGVEAAVHAVRSSFLWDDTEGILLVDASNAFNSLNRIVALHNIRQLCPSFAPILIKTLTGQLLLCTLHVIPYCPKRVLLLLPCLCMPWPPCL